MESVGQILRKRCEERGVSLRDLSAATRIPIRVLESLHDDRFEDLPAEVFVRGFLRANARALSIPIDDLMSRYTLSRRAAGVALRVEPPPAMPKRKWGAAIALAVLVILFA